MAGFCVNSKGRSFIRGKIIDDSLRGSIGDWIIAEGGDPASGYIKYFQLNHVVTKAKDRRLMKYIVELVEARARDHDVLQRPKECTVAHRGKTQLDSPFRTQDCFPEHNNLFQNTTIFFRTQQSFLEHNDLFQNKTRFSETQQQTETQQKLVKHNKISKYW